MRVCRFVLAIATIELTVFSLPCAFGQSVSARDVLIRSVTAHGGRIPGDLIARGTIDVTEGASVDSGTIRILIRNLDQTGEFIDLSNGKRVEVNSRGIGAFDRGVGSEDPTLEWAANSQSAYFPLITIAAALSNLDSKFELTGIEDVNGAKAFHIKLRNTYASRTKLAHLAPFSLRELWIDANSALPIKLAYDQREGGGNAPTVRVEFIYSDYRQVAGVLFPHSIEKSYNGSPWGKILIKTISENAGLTDDSFKIQ